MKLGRTRPCSKLRPPPGIANVGLAARNVAHVTRVDHPYPLDRVFEDPVDWLPVHARGLHPHQVDPPFDQPVRECQQLRRGRPALGHLLATAVAVIGKTGTRHHRVAMHIQERATLLNHLHLEPPGLDENTRRVGPDGGLVMKKLRCVLEATERSARYPRVKLTTGSKRHRKHDDSPGRHARDCHPHKSGPARGHGANRANPLRRCERCLLPRSTGKKSNRLRSVRSDSEQAPNPTDATQPAEPPQHDRATTHYEWLVGLFGVHN
jgi:hypothetical protein